MRGVPLTAADLVDIVERDFVAAWWLLAESTEAERHHDESIRWFRSGLPEAYSNQVLVTRLADADADTAIRDVAARVGRDGTPFTWWVMPSFTPADLPDGLERYGLVGGGAWPAFALTIDRIADPPSVDGLEIRRVTNSDDLDAYLAIVAQTLSPSEAFTTFLGDACRHIGFGTDVPEEHVIGLLDGTPVATASVVVAGGAAGIYNVGTLKPARGRGIGAAITAAAVRRGAARGLRVATLQSSTMGRRIYERLGFRFVCDFIPYCSPP